MSEWERHSSFLRRGRMLPWLLHVILSQLSLIPKIDPNFSNGNKRELR